MTREDARKLLPLVNDPQSLELLKFLAEVRIRDRKKSLEECELKDVQGHQEVIRELRKFFCESREYIQSKAQ